MKYIYLLIIFIVVIVGLSIGLKAYNDDLSKKRVVQQFNADIKLDSPDLASKLSEIDKKYPGLGTQMLQDDLNNHNAIARLGGYYVGLPDARFEYRTLTKYYANQKPNIKLDDPKKDELIREVVKQLAIEGISLEAAQSRGIMVSDSEVNDQFAKVVSSAGGEQKFVEILNQYYGWDIDDFKKKLKKQVIFGKLNAALGGQSAAPTGSDNSTYSSYPSVNKLGNIAIDSHMEYLYGNEYKQIIIKVSN